MTPASLAATHLPLARSVAASYARKGIGDIDDLTSLACVGLMESAHRFDTSRGLAFSTPAVHRIRGAILDGIRAEHGRGWRPTREEGDPNGYPHPGDSPEQATARSEMAAFVRSALATLEPRERAIIEGVYWGDKSLEEAGAELGMAKSTACEVRGRAIKRLRVRLRAVEL